jgi:hypothetical protein
MAWRKCKWCGQEVPTVANVAAEAKAHGAGCKWRKAVEAGVITSHTQTLGRAKADA